MGNIKSDIVNNVILQMSAYIDSQTMDVLQKVIEEQFVFVNMEEITTLPAQVRTETEEQNRRLIQLMLIKKRNLARETRQQYQDAVTRLITVVEKPLDQMDEMDIDFYLRTYERRHMVAGGKKNQASTYNNERRYLSAFFSWMRKEKLIAYNPVEGTEPMKEVRKPIDYFRPAQIEELRTGCRNYRDRAVIEVLRSTGARVGEVCSINRDEIDWATGDILILGEKGGRYRTLFVDETARYHLKRYIDSREDDCEALFVSIRKPYTRLTVSGLRNSMKQIAEREGMKCRVYPHKLRKTLGMTMKNAGIDIGIIQEVLGHANPAVTSRYYAALTPESMRSIRQRTAA